MDQQNYNPTPSRRWAAATVVGIGSKLSEEKQRSWEFQSGKCLFKLRRCQAHAETIRDVYQRIEQIPPEEFLVKIGVVKGELIKKRFYSYYAGDLAPTLFFNVDGFFESAKSCADFSLDMLGSMGSLKNPQSSMNSFVKDLKRHRQQSGKEITARIDSYWSECGYVVKSYRDCFTHFVALAGDHWQTAINVKCESGVTYVRYFLPDNPNVNKNSQFTFEDHIDARNLVVESLRKLEKYIEDMLIMAANEAGLESGDEVKVPQTYDNVSVGTW